MTLKSVISVDNWVYEPVTSYIKIELFFLWLLGKARRWISSLKRQCLEKAESGVSQHSDPTVPAIFFAYHAMRKIKLKAIKNIYIFLYFLFIIIATIQRCQLEKCITFVLVMMIKCRAALNSAIQRVLSRKKDKKWSRCFLNTCICKWVLLRLKNVLITVRKL